jgi:hypothetical protein
MEGGKHSIDTFVFPGQAGTSEPSVCGMSLAAPTPKAEASFPGEESSQ